MRGKGEEITCVEVKPEDHPRLCGEKLFEVSFLCEQHGSPPPMRGKDDMIEINEAYSRITPAYAGKS